MASKPLISQTVDPNRNSKLLDEAFKLLNEMNDRRNVLYKAYLESLGASISDTGDFTEESNEVDPCEGKLQSIADQLAIDLSQWPVRLDITTLQFSPYEVYRLEVILKGRGFHCNTLIEGLLTVTR